MADDPFAWDPATAREYDVVAIEREVVAIYDDATRGGHMLKHGEYRGGSSSVVLYRCSGCVAVYKLFLPGRTSHVSDECGSALVAGICPASYEAIAERAWGEDGGLVDWHVVDLPRQPLTGLADYLSALGHGGLRIREPIRKAGQVSLLMAHVPDTLVACMECGWLLAKLKALDDVRSWVWVTHICCPGRSHREKKGR